jgi:signal transduction histidine kinase
VITFHDVGEHLRQQQRLEVLNRVLRHNIRTETNLISGYAEVIDREDGEGTTDLIKSHAERIDELGEKAREIADIFEREGDPTEAVPLGDLLVDAVGSIEAEYSDVAVEYRPPPADVHVARVFGPVFSNVMENAAEHNTNASPRVRVTVETTEDLARVHVADNGPGIHEYERAVLERGKETPLEHGSGLGLWLIKWGASIGGGRIAFEENEPTGSIITVEAPIRPPTGSPDRESDAVAS